VPIKNINDRIDGIKLILLLTIKLNLHISSAAVLVSNTAISSGRAS